MKLYNRDREHLIVENLELAQDRRSRTRGLIGHPPLALGQGLLIRPCRWIHTFGMSFPIDVVFVSGDWRVVAVSENLPPKRVDRPVLRARAAVEMAAGAIRHTGLKVGDRLELRS
jgi:uncharacterized membrane protein (UPF0127 family)